MHSHGPHVHLVQFYEDERCLITGIADFIGAALSGGHKGIVIATRAHLDQLEPTLRQRGVLGADAAQWPDEFTVLLHHPGAMAAAVPAQAPA